MNALQRIIDRIRHPGEYEYQRGYRRYLEGLDHASPAEPYVLTTTREVTDGGEWPVSPRQMLENIAAWDARHPPQYGPIVGVTFTLADTITEPSREKAQALFDATKQMIEAEKFDLATIDTERNMRYVAHPFVSSEPYVNYCGLCALSTSDHNPGPNYVDPMNDEPELYDEWSRAEDAIAHVASDHFDDEPDPDAMYDAAVDQAVTDAAEAGDLNNWKAYMPNGEKGGRA